MRHTRGASCCLLVGMVVATSVLAEEYDFEIALAFDSTQFDGSNTTTTSGGTIFNSGETDTDNLRVSGSWYFAGLSDDKGPRARAMLVDRASSLSVGYSRLEHTVSQFLSSNDPSLPVIPPIDSTFELDGDLFAVDFRYVDRDSGWFGNAGLLTSNFTLGVFIDDSVDANGWNLGVGKYLFETTTLSLDVGQTDILESDATVVAVSFSHLGDLGERWQYAVDLGYSRLDSDLKFDTDTWAASIALYPTRDFEFGVSVEDVSGNNGFFGSSGFLDTTGIEGFASWFVTPNVRLSARYRVDDVAFFGNFFNGGASTVSDTDQKSFGISATVRF